MCGSWPGSQSSSFVEGVAKNSSKNNGDGQKFIEFSLLFVLCSLQLELDKEYSLTVVQITAIRDLKQTDEAAGKRRSKANFYSETQRSSEFTQPLTSITPN